MPHRKTSGDKTLMDVLSELSPTIMSNGQIRCQCPFRDNHTDGSGRMSMFLSPEINAYHCFSCGVHGNLVRLLTTRFSIGYFDAVGMVKLTDYKSEAKEFDLDRMWEIRPPDVFMERGYTPETLKHFRVGITDADAILIPYYKDFSHPTELLGYQERWYVPDRRVKNSKGFDKKSYLYNFDTDYDYVILVEGQSDVWRVFQHGYNATALMGADLSSRQVKMLSRFKRVYLALDNDEAGRRGTEIAYHLLKNHTDIMLIPYPTKDPGECPKKEWDAAFTDSTDYIEYSMAMSIGWEGYLEMRKEVLREISHRHDDLEL